MEENQALVDLFRLLELKPSMVLRNHDIEKIELLVNEFKVFIEENPDWKKSA